MCDTSRRSACLRSTGRWIGPLKLSKCELPIPGSRSYWDGVCAEIEKKHKRVRDAYPSSLSTLSAPSSAVADRTQFRDDFKFEISPPTPMHKIQNAAAKSDRIPASVINDVELPAAFFEKRKQKFCPIHKRTDDDDDATTHLPDIAEKRSQSTSASSTRSRRDIVAHRQRAATKAPKLGAASLLASFARPVVSTDSSAGTTRSSLDSEDELARVSPDLLRVPNLSFVSSHPSFRELSLGESDDDEASVNVDGRGSGAESRDAKTKDEVVEEKISEGATDEKTAEKKERKVKTMADLEKKYAYKALEVLTKRRHANNSSIPDVRKLQKLMRSLDNESSMDFREIREKLKRPRSEQKSASECRTILSASRSTSSSSPDFESKAIEIPSSDALARIPETKVFQRAYVDKCHACLFKPFGRPTKITRELPLSTLISVIKDPPDFCRARSSSSSSSSTFEVPDFEDDITDSEDTFAAKKPDVKDLPRVSFDQSNLAAIETREKSQSPKPQSDHHLGEQSMSMQSSDRSRTSTPTNQSSESDEARGPQDADKVPESKSRAPCHKPVVLRKSLDPFRALRQKKFVPLRARAAAITAVSIDGSGSDSQEEEVAPTKTDEAGEKKDDEKQKKTKTKKKKKKLMRRKSVAEKLTEVKRKKVLKRAKTTFDLLDASEHSETDESASEEEEEASVESKESKVDGKEEQLPLADAILMHRAASPPSPIMSSHDVVDVIKECLQRLEDFTPANLLNSLGREFARRMSERYERLKHSEDTRYLKLGRDLFDALMESRRYLKPQVYDPNLKFSHKQPPLCNSRLLRRILPPTSYALVAPILGMPPCAGSVEEVEEDSLSSESSESELSYDLYVNPPTSQGSEGTGKTGQVNPYALFLRKPRRKAIIWRALREEDMKGYDPEATLEMRATRLMDRICKDFCDWVKQLGDDGSAIDEETLKDMFEINFSSQACKSTQVIVKEMPTVPMPVVKARYCPAANELEAARKQMRRDLRVEARPRRTFAFGRVLPKELRFVPPRTSIRGKWLECEHIPKDLDNMDVVWDDIGQLDSVQEFYQFLKSKKVLRSTKLLRNLDEVTKGKA